MNWITSLNELTDALIGKVATTCDVMQPCLNISSDLEVYIKEIFFNRCEDEIKNRGLNLSKVDIRFVYVDGKVNKTYYMLGGENKIFVFKFKKLHKENLMEDEHYGKLYISSVYKIGNELMTEIGLKGISLNNDEVLMKLTKSTGCKALYTE